MTAIVVTTSLDEETYKKWRASGVKLNHLVRMGIMAFLETPGYINRIHDLEEGNARLQRKLTALSQSIQEVH